KDSSYLTAPVLVDGNVIFPVRGLQAFPAEERANRIGTLIAETAQNESIKSDAITAVESDQTTDIVANGRVIMSVLESDARSEGVTRQELAKICVRKIREAVDRYRDDRSPRELGIAAIRSAIATVVLVVCLFLIRTVFRRLQKGDTETGIS